MRHPFFPPFSSLHPFYMSLRVSKSEFGTSQDERKFILHFDEVFYVVKRIVFFPPEANLRHKYYFSSFYFSFPFL